MSRTAFVALIVAIAVSGALTACSTMPRTETTGSIVWHGCGAIECATLSVPLDYAHPGGRHIELSLARHPATGKRTGVLFTNPGGPGGSGIDFVEVSQRVSEVISDFMAALKDGRREL